MAERKLETLVQSVLARVNVVAGTERIGTRLADRATPTFLPFGWHPSKHADVGPNPMLANRGQPAMSQRSGLRAGRSASLTGSLRSRHLGISLGRRATRRSMLVPCVATSQSAGCPAVRRRGYPGAVV